MTKKTDEFDFGVPRDLIAQEPVTPRDSSRLMVLDRGRGQIEHAHFRDLPQLLHQEDVLVLNDSRVIAARLRGHLKGSPMDSVTILLLRDTGADTWEMMVEVGECQVGDFIDFTGSSGKILSIGEKIGKRKEVLGTILLEDRRVLGASGEMPVPPYIHSLPEDPERYQTVYSKELGSAAAPTAGLHFTERLLLELDKKGVRILFVTLHVGIDTFMPVLEETPEEHKMYKEFCQVSKETAEYLNKAREFGGRVICVGTTSVRTLESAALDGKVTQWADWTGKYILPGYEFQTVDTMITNFHYPKSTNLMMVSAFAGYDLLRRAYEEAVKLQYRFYSFGDSMMIV